MNLLKKDIDTSWSMGRPSKQSVTISQETNVDWWPMKGKPAPDLCYYNYAHWPEVTDRDRCKKYDMVCQMQFYLAWNAFSNHFMPDRILQILDNQKDSVIFLDIL